ncbi:hypothetical protein OCGS_1935 [Oceaniovalibus guishaninsula JLT2003]|uniref:DNA ligase (ATP) n=1 Tax=Oceaniovalibus guishaninsula JLT2003 TaxID=1231392 RepID=K2HM43_9RHOB|nr:DNA ligase D [Oceaniovalibus guishaninsula]EKE43954.1 hypothetical protein OCGS_1935 [Oceaniovalibus guishaninsula JLT2003]
MSAARDPDPLAEYKARRDFDRTAEPAGTLAEARRDGLRFLVQKHDATRLHWDFRLEWNGVLLSWAVTRGPSDDPHEKRLAVRTEDHPLDYGTFEGTIPAGQYGGGTVMMWDHGTYTPDTDMDAGLETGKLKVTLQGHRMRGGWALVRMRRKPGEKRENWLLIKERDAFARDDADRLTRDHLLSVQTGRAMDAIAQGAPPGDPPEPDTPARRKKRPAFTAPQLATLVDAAPDGDDWIHETKFDGYRCLAAIGKGGARLYTRSGKDWTDRFAALSRAFDPLPCDAALLDGEVMAAYIRGSAFSSLQRALKDGAPLVYYAFDLLSLDGTDLRRSPLIDRRARLADLLSGLPPNGPLRISAHTVGDGPALFAAACKAGAEGIVSKRADAPYRGARTRAWVKVKCTRRQEFVIGGYTPSDKPGRPFASLLVGQMENGALAYRGRVGTGFSADDLVALAAAFTPRQTSPFDDVPRAIARDARWIRPDLVAEVDFTELTADGHVRHGSFLGLRHDKPAAGVTPERPASDDTPRIAGVRLSSGDREIFPRAGCTKRDLARYVEAAGDRLTRIAGHRPLSLLRLPTGLQGQRFFQKHAGKGWPSELQRIEIAESDGNPAEYLYATRPASFVAAVQMGAIEFHVWGARTDRLDRPDRLVFDLDPDEGLGWPQTRDAAFDVRDRLAALGLASTPVVTGGKGVHVCTILRRTREWDTVKLFARTFAHILERDAPDRYVATMSKARRKGRIFVDWLRNERGSTAIAPYSVRARPGAPVAVPVAWDELAGLDAADTFRMAHMADRLAAPCPYLAALDDPQSLNAATIDRLDG